MIAARSLLKRYGPTVILDDVSLDLTAGESLALLGPNGAGKTTLLRILATLLRPTSGALSIDGIDALRDPAQVRERIGMAGHGSYLYSDLTALENLRFWAIMGNGDAGEHRLRSALQQVELDGSAHERVRTFSAGMKRRLALARVLLGRARLLLLDEPFTELDQRGRKWLGEFLLAFKGEGGSILVATHSFGSGLGIADRVAILHGGRIILDRPSRDLLPDELRRLYDSLTEGNGTAA
jgi:heme ABC exporter ATP-binding subunit CcmA